MPKTNYRTYILRLNINVKPKYYIERETLDFVRNLYRQQHAEHPDCQIGFGWGGDSTGRRGVICGIYEDTSEPMPPMYLYEDVSIYFAFPDNIPEEFKTGVLFLHDKEFRIRPVADFQQDELIEGAQKVGSKGGKN